MGHKHKKHLKSKKREAKLKKQKLHEKGKQNEDRGDEAKKRGMLHIYLIIAISVLGSAFIIYNLG